MHTHTHKHTHTHTHTHTHIYTYSQVYEHKETERKTLKETDRQTDKGRMQQNIHKCNIPEYDIPIYFSESFKCSLNLSQVHNLKNITSFVRKRLSMNQQLIFILAVCIVVIYHDENIITMQTLLYILSIKNILRP